MSYDLLIIGGGITGACAAWDASLRGLSVALVDKGDFGAATSAASGKLIHGGIRYMQYGALHRVRESLHERMVFQRIAPHFIHQVPFLIPTYEDLLRSKHMLVLGMTVYDFLAQGKTLSEDPERVIPRHRPLSRKEALRLAPDIVSARLTGGVLYHECQMHNPERLTLSFLLSANEIGASLANYVKATQFFKQNNRIAAVKVEDLLTGERFDIRARAVLNAAGPWIPALLKDVRKGRTGMRFRSFLRRKSKPTLPFVVSKGIHVVTRRALTENTALALTTHHGHHGALLNRGGRHFFIVPWRHHYSLIGTTNVPFSGSPDEKMVTERDIEGLIQEINAAHPAARLTREDVAFSYGGLYPDEMQKISAGKYQGGRKDQLVDHSAVDKVNGLISAIGVKYTTCRRLAQRTIDLVFRKLGYNPPKCTTENTPLYGGQIKRLHTFVEYEKKKRAPTFSEETIRHLIDNYGTSYTRVIHYAEKDPARSRRIKADVPVIEAQVIHAVREEMALKLADVVFRRTGLGTVGNPGEESLRTCAFLMADELNWDSQRTRKELAEVREAFTPAP